LPRSQLKHHKNGEQQYSQIKSPNDCMKQVVF
jgi:hypothetical protein